MSCCETQNLAVGYGAPLLRDIALHAERGKILALIGPNGAGKSTLLKTLAGQLAAQGGAVLLDGQDLTAYTPNARARKLALMLPHTARTELATCFDVAAAGRYPYTGRLGLLTAADRKKVHNALARVHAADLAERQFSQISDGQKQRVLLARALCQEPELLILDEPTSFLDIHHKLELLAILKQLVREQQLAVILTLHELDLAQKVSDKILCAAHGHIDRFGAPDEIFVPQYIEALYGVQRGSYNALFGSLELQPPDGPAQVFVIGGGGAGIPVYRALQRRGIAFAAGILAENDLDTPVAKALAHRVFTVPAFEPVAPQDAAAALPVLRSCRAVVCAQPAFGTLNRENRLLVQEAEALGLLQPLSEI